MKMKKITTETLKDMLEEMSDAELNSFILNQFQLLEEACKIMSYRNFSYKLKNTMLRND